MNAIIAIIKIFMCHQKDWDTVKTIYPFLNMVHHIKYCNMFTVLAKPSKASGKGEECFGGRKEQSCGLPHPGEWHLQKQESALPILCVSLSLCSVQDKLNNNITSLHFNVDSVESVRWGQILYFF